MVDYIRENGSEGRGAPGSAATWPPLWLVERNKPSGLSLGVLRTDAVGEVEGVRSNEVLRPPVELNASARLEVSDRSLSAIPPAWAATVAALRAWADEHGVLLDDPDDPIAGWLPIHDAPALRLAPGPCVWPRVLAPGEATP